MKQLSALASCSKGAAVYLDAVMDWRSLDPFESILTEKNITQKKCVTKTHRRKWSELPFS